MGGVCGIRHKKGRLNITGTAKADELLVRAAARDLAKVPKSPGAASLTLAMVKKKLQGKAVYDGKNRVLKLTYEFKSPEQLKDFDATGASPTLKGGFLQVPAGDRLKHLVKFKTVTVTGVVAITGAKGKLITTSEGVELSLIGGATDTNPLNIHFQGNLVNVSHALAPNERSGNIPFELNLATAQIGHRFAGRKANFPSKKDQAGFLEFHGGEGGFGYAQLTISGTMDEDWAREFFAAPAPTVSGLSLGSFLVWSPAERRIR
jgi:hypothetical protein